MKQPPPGGLVGHPCGSGTFVAGVRCLMPGETLTARYDGGRLAVSGARPHSTVRIGPGGARDLAGERRTWAALANAVAATWRLTRTWLSPYPPTSTPRCWPPWPGAR